MRLNQYHFAAQKSQHKLGYVLDLRYGVRNADGKRAPESEFWFPLADAIRNLANKMGHKNWGKTMGGDGCHITLLPAAAEDGKFVQALKADPDVQKALKPVREVLALATAGIIPQEKGGRTDR